MGCLRYSDPGAVRYPGAAFGGGKGMMELKPCPFCGGEAILGTWRDEHRRLNPSVVHCSVCHVETRIYERNKEAVAAWNRRVGDDLMERMEDDGKEMRGFFQGRCDPL